MNPLLNPFISIPLLKSYLFDPGRLRKTSREEIKRYKDKMLRKIIRYAYQIPLYHEKYKEAGIHIDEIRSIEDIDKIPLLSKEELRAGFPDKLLPIRCNKKGKYEVCTGGTTGKPVCIYTDFYTMGKSSAIIIRELRELKLDLKNIKLAHIGNFTPRRIDLVVQQHFQPHVKFIAASRHLNIDVNTPIKEIIGKLDEFKPDLIMSYPAILQHLAYLKRKGYGSNVKPKICWTGGAMIDEYTRRYIEDAFKCRVLNIYPSVEAGSDIAFECLHGTWHIHEDFFHVEAIDENMETVAPGE
ncbi:MAG TPA: phenylacetate--CoA ligase family protein, partial [Thermoplasmatales archaeon]|nr:phenylacetate--CoA ligase family protein [Thermoplasmatales archaeon]